MKTSFARPFALFLIFLIVTTQTWATCGGGGGGGMGGMGGGPSATTYPVPWKIIAPTAPAPKEGLVVYWLPASQNELNKSSLLNSRTLSNYATQCVTLGIVDYRTDIGKKYVTDGKLPVLVVATPDGTPVSKLESKDGKLYVDQVEKLLDSEVKKRENAVKEKMENAKAKAKAGDNQTAIAELRAVYDQKCMFPGRAKDAAKELKKLGVTVAEVPDGPVYDRVLSAKIERTMIAGLKAENAGKYTEAQRLYELAHQLDPADPVPLRYLGEVYRHHLGDWIRARQVFNAILRMPADPMSRAVAMHGLGKMTIHEGQFKKGLGLMEQSVAEYPLALAYRNLAVYWNSEGDNVKADQYAQQALTLDPADPYNIVFSAVFRAASGHTDEALKIARENEGLLPASYNLAAIYAEAGQKDKALALLKRHFFTYERNDAVRSKEMMEARVDTVFASLKNDPAFLTLTSGADGMLDPNRTMGARSGTL
ncbi:MAG TPA: tetratricopeptide repeat protein [Verrucomicrobiae bacterium]|nr:tetratricopeptide repeat protein [Verrucomicrobiae bacterium]